MKLKILYIDDEKVNLSNFELTYEFEYETAIFLRAEEALAWIDENPDVAIVICDQRMGAGTGLEVLEKVLHKVPKAIRILVNSYVITPEIEDAAETGLIMRCIQKPWNANDFAATIRMSKNYYLLAQQKDELLLKLSETKQKLISAEDVFEQRYRDRCAEFTAAKHALIEEIAEFRRKLAEQESVNEVLQKGMVRSTKKLTGILPICASCKKIRDEDNSWNHVEVYFEKNTDVYFTHGICPECVKRAYSEEFKPQFTEIYAQSGKG